MSLIDVTDLDGEASRDIELGGEHALLEKDLSETVVPLRRKHRTVLGADVRVIVVGLVNDKDNEDIRIL